MSAELAVQGAIVATLKGDGALTSLVSGRVHDRIEADTPLPYVQLRQLQAVQDDNDCAESWEVFVDIDAWSGEPGKPQASRIAAAVRSALHLAELELVAPYALVEIRHRDTQIGEGDTPLLTRARMSFRALVERV